MSVKRTKNGEALNNTDVSDDFWLPDEDLMLLNDACTKKQKKSPASGQRSAEWSELTTEMPWGLMPCHIQGVIVNISKTKKDRRKKIYLKRGEDIGLCLVDQNACLENIKIGTSIMVWIGSIFRTDGKKDISNVICTCRFGIMAASEIVLEYASEVNAQVAKFDWHPTVLDMSLAECYDLSQSKKTLEYQARVYVVWAMEPTVSKKQKVCRRSVTIRDCNGMTATLVLSIGVEDLEAGRELVISGFGIELERGSFKISLGPDSAVQVCGLSHDATVPHGTRVCSIDSIKNVLESKTGPFEDVYEIEGLITQFALRRSVYGMCGPCGAWQLVLNRKICKKCGLADFVKLKFDIIMALADETGEWSGIHLRDPLASVFLRNTPYECKLAEAEQDAQLSWVKATVKVCLTKDHLKAIVLEISKATPNT